MSKVKESNSKAVKEPDNKDVKESNSKAVKEPDNKAVIDTITKILGSDINYLNKIIYKGYSIQWFAQNINKFNKDIAKKIFKKLDKDNAITRVEDVYCFLNYIDESPANNVYRMLLCGKDVKDCDISVDGLIDTVATNEVDERLVSFVRGKYYSDKTIEYLINIICNKSDSIFLLSNILSGTACEGLKAEQRKRLVRAMVERVMNPKLNYPAIGFNMRFFKFIDSYVYESEKESWINLIVEGLEKNRYAICIGDDEDSYEYLLNFVGAINSSSDNIVYKKVQTLLKVSEKVRAKLNSIRYIDLKNHKVLDLCKEFVKSGVSLDETAIGLGISCLLYSCYVYHAKDVDRKELNKDLKTVYRYCKKFKQKSVIVRLPNLENISQGDLKEMMSNGIVCNRFVTAEYVMGLIEGEYLSSCEQFIDHIQQCIIEQPEVLSNLDKLVHDANEECQASYYELASDIFVKLLTTERRFMSRNIDIIVPIVKYSCLELSLSKIDKVGVDNLSNNQVDNVISKDKEKFKIIAESYHDTSIVRDEYELDYVKRTMPNTFKKYYKEYDFNGSDDSLLSELSALGDMNLF